MVQPSDSWGEYRKTRNISLFAFVAYIPVVFAVGSAIRLAIFNVHARLRGGRRLDGVLSYC
jgi:hypothetical protein